MTRHKETPPLSDWQRQFLHKHQLSPEYLREAQQWFAPLADSLVRHQRTAARPALIAVSACQGLGKSTLCDYLRLFIRAQHGLQTVVLSLDDFYLTRAQRAQLACAVHPLLATRGVPGTHDIALLTQTLDALLAADAQSQIEVPRFDKSRDDRRPRSEWDRIAGQVDLVLLEGWCLGARAQALVDLKTPINTLEREEDVDGRWRTYVNGQLANVYEPLYPRVDQWVFLQAPSFDCVYRWRLEQEQKQSRRKSEAGADRHMTAAQLARFVQHFERLTRVCLEQLPQWVQYCYVLDEHRRVMGVSGTSTKISSGLNGTGLF